MSSTGRRKAGEPAEGRQEKDNYPTPLWAIRAIVAGIWPQVVDPRRRPDPARKIHVLDPCVGDGGFLVELARLSRSRGITFTGVDVRQDAIDAAAQAFGGIGGSATLTTGDFLDASTPVLDGYDLVLSNPPYGAPGSDLAAKFVRRSLEVVRPGGRVAMLLRLNWASDGEHDFGRSSWLRAGNMPDVMVLDRRPAFVKGSTDSVGYAAMVWTRGEYRRVGTFDVLPCRRGQVIPVLDALGFDTAHDRPEDWRKVRARAEVLAAA